MQCRHPLCTPGARDFAGNLPLRPRQPTHPSGLVLARVQVGTAPAPDQGALGIVFRSAGARDHDARKGLRTSRVVVETVDDTDREQFLPWLAAFDEIHPVNLVIANAGISIEKDNSSLGDFSIARKTLDANINGVLNTIEPWRRG